MSQTGLERTSTDMYTLPLTLVSLDYGTEGLELRLQHELDELGLKNNHMVQEGIELGLALHHHDSRTYEPYGNHLLRVALRLIEFEVKDPTVLAAAMLHDGLEDHPGELAEYFLGGGETEVSNPHVLRKLGYQGLRAFGLQHDEPGLADLVLAVSNPLRLNGEDKIESYNRHVRNLMYGDNARAKALKTADLFDNMDVPPGLEDPEKRWKMDRKQIGVYGYLEDGLDSNSLIVGAQRERVRKLTHHLYAGAIERLDNLN
jgi:hypothetical protein